MGARDLGLLTLKCGDRNFQDMAKGSKHRSVIRKRAAFKEKYKAL